MRAGGLPMLLLLTGLAGPCVSIGADTSDDRIALSANGESLTRTNGGGGASLAWLHNVDPDTLASVAVEHQGIANSQWTFGSLLGSLGRDLSGAHYNFYGEIHEGGGADGPRHFDYQIEAAGVSGTFLRHFTAQLEDRQIDVLPVHGNLPKLALAYLWNAHLLTSASFASSVSGNLGTHLGAVRMDYYQPALNFLAGAAYGLASATVLGTISATAQGPIVGVVAPAKRVKEGFVGVSKPFPHARGELTLVADYLDLSRSRRATLTLSYIFHLGHADPAR